ncbi:MAG: RNA polymerase sigma factor [Phaeodactylibacter sp.]|nr:RNA polymerase sigma factor [Phaeodactylibacter sp.]MCB9303429.1 RNA polymerase sigma factor [Lewinellaceae bacterium]HQU58287.1 RNA polymerase sigma factor [Saprospiraceae bacterium]
MLSNHAGLAINTVETERNTGPLSLHGIIDACIRGERQAQHQLYQQFFNSLFAICLRYASDHDEARSLVNQAFLKAFQALEQCKDVQAFPAWINRIAVNTCLDHIRKLKSKQTMALEDAPEPAIPSSALDKLEAEDLLKLVQQLPPLNRAVFSLYVVEGYKHEEIAQELGMSVGTSRWHLSTAKKALKNLLQNYY